MRTKLTALAVSFVAALAIGSTAASAQDHHRGGGDRGQAARGHDNGPRGDWRGGDRHPGRGGWNYRGYYPQPYYGRPWPTYSGYDWPSERARWLCYNRGICPDWYYQSGYPPRYYEPGLSFDLNLR